MTHRSCLPAEERRVVAQLRKLLSTPGLMRGNLVRMKRKCGKVRCRCFDGKHLHVSWYVSQSRDGRPHMVYVPKHWEQRVRAFTRRHREVRNLVERLSKLYWKRLERREE